MIHILVPAPRERLVTERQFGREVAERAAADRALLVERLGDRFEHRDNARRRAGRRRDSVDPRGCHLGSDPLADHRQRNAQRLILDPTPRSRLR